MHSGAELGGVSMVTDVVREPSLVHLRRAFLDRLNRLPPCEPVFDAMPKLDTRLTAPPAQVHGDPANLRGKIRDTGVEIAQHDAVAFNRGNEFLELGVLRVDDFRPFTDRAEQGLAGIEALPEDVEEFLVASHLIAQRPKPLHARRELRDRGVGLGEREKPFVDGLVGHQAI